MVEESKTEHRGWTPKEKGEFFRKQVVEEEERIRELLRRTGFPGQLDEPTQAAIKRAATYRVSSKWQKDRLRKEGFADPLTGLDNRRSFERSLPREIAEARRSGESLGVILADLDLLKEVNDLHGHLAGDDVLRGVAKLLKKTSRAEDLVARWGGEEFVILLPDAGREEVEKAAERLRTAIEETPIDALTNTGIQSLKVTSSFGGTTLKDGDSSETIMQRVDQALYKSKRERNTVTVV